MPGDLHCPLCASDTLSPYASDQRRTYLECVTCKLVFVPPEHYLSREAERAEYDIHENDPADPGYRTFLSRLADPLTQRLAPGASGLDLLEKMREAWPSVPTVILTAHGTIDAAVSSMQRGAFDFLVKPVDVTRLRELVARVRGANELVDRAGLTDPRVENELPPCATITAAFEPNGF